MMNNTKFASLLQKLNVNIKRKFILFERTKIKIIKDKKIIYKIQ